MYQNTLRGVSGSGWPGRRVLIELLLPMPVVTLRSVAGPSVLLLWALRDAAHANTVQSATQN